MPDRATRYLVAELSRRGVDCFCLVDGDPCGLNIFLTYYLGSWQLVHETDALTCDKLRLVGIKPLQFKELGFSPEVLLPFNATDQSRVTSMKAKVSTKLSQLEIDPDCDSAYCSFENSQRSVESFELI